MSTLLSMKPRHPNRFNVPAYPERAKSVIAHHVTPEHAGEVFAKAKPRLAVYSHIVQPDADEQDLIPPTRKTYAGPVQVGEDLMVIEVDGWRSRKLRRYNSHRNGGATAITKVRHSRIIACPPPSFARSPLLPNHVGRRRCARNSVLHDLGQGVRFWPLSHACQVETRPQGSPMVERRLNGEHHDNAYGAQHYDPRSS